MKLKVKHYTVEEMMPSYVKGEHIYNIEYRVSKDLKKGIRFTFLEHKIQFIDLLKEAGYEEVK